MIDDSAFANFLMKELELLLPFRAMVDPKIRARLPKNAVPASDSPWLEVRKLFYTGNMGGILCQIADVESDNKTLKNPCLLSLTHLIVDPRLPIIRDVILYQKRRVKKLKKQNDYGPA